MEYRFNNAFYKCEPSKTNYQKKFLLGATQLCWNRYSNRLTGISDEYRVAGDAYYKLSNKLIVDSIAKLNPSNISLSVTEDGSLHYTIKFKNDVTLFIESFLNLEQENNIYFELFENQDKIFSNEISLGDGLLEIKKIMESKEQRTEHGNTFSNYDDVKCEYIS